MINSTVYHKCSNEKKGAEFTVYLDFSSPAWFFCWDVVCNSPHGVSVARDMWTTSGRTETVIIHSTEGVNWMKTGRTYLQLWLNKRQGIVVLCFWLSSVIWEQDPVSQPGRQQVLLPVVLLSQSLLVDWNRSQHLLTFLSGCERNRKMFCGEKHWKWKKMASIL